MSQLPDQRDLIKRRNWDYLIVLDACRYDFFEAIFKKFLEGSLRKVRSPGSSTLEWLVNLFLKDQQEHSDIVYVSANPHVNSKGVEIGGGFNAKALFHQVIDVWEWGWNNKLKTVLPKKVEKATREARAEYQDKKLISHFMQPHIPYLSLQTVESALSTVVTRRKRKRKSRNPLQVLSQKARKETKNLLGGFQSRRIWQKVKKFTRPQFQGPNQTLAHKYGSKALIQAYRKNIEAALKSVKNLAQHLSGKMVVTSDHGELLGENGNYGHPLGSTNRILRDVPWLEVYSSGKRSDQIQ